MEKNNEILPIGTVVMLKEGKRPLMITSMKVQTNGKVYDKFGEVDLTNQVFDYGGCFYPEGMVQSDRMFAFNSNQIKEVCFVGYQTELQKKMALKIMSMDKTNKNLTN